MRTSRIGGWPKNRLYSRLNWLALSWTKTSQRAAVELTADDLREIESAASKITVQGARYPEHLEKLVGR